MIDFYEQATNKLNSTFPDLVGFVSAFRDMSDEVPDNSAIGIGCFVLAVGGKALHIPVLAKNGTVYPIDSVYSASTGKFWPLTKDTVRNITQGVDFTLGKPTTTPATVVKNPSVYDLVTPPRTGKFAYASKGGVVELVASAPNRVKQMVKSAFADYGLVRKLLPALPMKDIIDAAKTETPVETLVKQEKPAVEVISGGKDLPESIVQEILEHGFAVLGSPAQTRLAALSKEYGPRRAFYNIGRNLEPGKAYTLVRTDGTTIDGFVPHECDCGGAIILDNGYVYTDVYGKGPVAVCEKDFWETQHAIMSKFPVLALNELTAGQTVIIMEGVRYLGRGEVKSVVTGEVNKISLYNKTISQYPNYKGHPMKGPGGEWSVGPMAVAFVVPRDETESLTFDVNEAMAAVSLREDLMLPAKENLSVDCGDFWMGGKHLGGKPAAARVLIVQLGIEPAIAKSFIKAAEHYGSVQFRMSKQADEWGTNYTLSEMPEYGAKISSDDAQDKNIPGINTDAVQTAAQTGDEGVTEATLISELLQNPDMEGTISSYMPGLHEAVDKLGRVLFLARLKSDDLAGVMDYSDVDSLISSTRNAYRILGDNCLKLEQLVSNGSQDT